MNLKNDVKPISYIKTHAADILKQINETHNPIIITQNGEAKGVFIDTESYEKMKNTLSLLKIVSLAEKDISNNNLITSKDLFNRLDKKYNIK